MARLVPGHTEVVLRFRSYVGFGKLDQKLLKALDGPVKVFEVEFRISFPKNQLADEILRRQKTDETVVLIAVQIQEDHGGSPFHTEPAHQRLVLAEIDLKGNEAFLNSKTDVRIGIGDSLQLLTPNSEVIIIIHQDQFLFLPCLCLGLRE